MDGEGTPAAAAAAAADPTGSSPRPSTSTSSTTSAFAFAREPSTSFDGEAYATITALQLTVHEARRLGEGNKRAPDAYCVIKVPALSSGRPGLAGDECVRTKVAKRSGSPTWDEDVVVPLESLDKACATLHCQPRRVWLLLEVRDRELMTTDELLGHARLPLASLPLGERTWVRLAGPDIDSDGAALGSVCVSLRSVPDGYRACPAPTPTSAPTPAPTPTPATGDSTDYPPIAASTTAPTLFEAVPSLRRFRGTQLLVDAPVLHIHPNCAILSSLEAYPSSSDSQWLELVPALKYHRWGLLVLTTQQLVVAPHPDRRVAQCTCVWLGAVRAVAQRDWRHLLDGERSLTGLRGRALLAAEPTLVGVSTPDGREIFFGLVTGSEADLHRFSLGVPAERLTAGGIFHPGRSPAADAQCLVSEVHWRRSEAAFAPALGALLRPGGAVAGPWLEALLEDYDRLGVLARDVWRLCKGNDDGYALCPSYPRRFAVPAGVAPEQLAQCSRERSKGRLPALTWLHPRHGAPLCRCAQPQQGMTARKLLADVAVLEAIRVSAADPATAVLRLIDARPRINAEANALKGKGYESVRHYQNTRLQFMGIENIHVMSSSLAALMKAVRLPNADFYAALSQSQWLKHVACVLRGACHVATLLDQGSPVVVHCSDGWDRTSQLCALAQVLLDPDYRTFRGFARLVEKDWCAFGHRFRDRCSTAEHRYASPVFLQFLDAVYQIVTQFPLAFEFTEHFLLGVADCAYAKAFNTFLQNSEQERLAAAEALPGGGVQAWDALFAASPTNPLYEPSQASVDLLNPLFAPSSMRLWEALYFRDSGLRCRELPVEAQLLIQAP